MFFFFIFIYTYIPVCSAGYDLSEQDRYELLTLIKCCADIQDYDRDSYDPDELMRGVLYTHRNFILLSRFSTEEGTINNGLRMCSERFIRDAMDKAFRLPVTKSSATELMNNGYYINNGYCYYFGGYSRYFATDVHDIVNTFYTPDNSLYIIFSDSYTEDGKTVDEYSTATAQRDDRGWYLTSIHMNSDFSDMPDFSASEPKPEPIIRNSIRRKLPAITALLSAAVAFVIVRVYII